MCKCFSFTEAKIWCLRSTFTKSGLRSTFTDLRDGTIMHCWVPNTRNDSKSDLLLIHGLGANALWQWADVVPQLVHYFNVYVPDLVFFGESFTTRPERTDSFQAECMMKVMEVNSVKKLSLVGMSYGGFVGYSMAVKFKENIERVLICCSGVCLEEKDFRGGMFKISDLEEASSILVPQSPEKLKQLMGFSLYKPPPTWLIPSCLLDDFIDVRPLKHWQCVESLQKRRGT